MKDISFWKEELLKEVHNMSEETSNLLVKYYFTVITAETAIFENTLLQQVNIIAVFNGFSFESIITGGR